MAALQLAHIKQLRIVFSAFDASSKGLRELLQRVSTDTVFQIAARSVQAR